MKHYADLRHSPPLPHHHREELASRLRGPDKVNGSHIPPPLPVWMRRERADPRWSRWPSSLSRHPPRVLLSRWIMELFAEALPSAICLRTLRQPGSWADGGLSASPISVSWQANGLRSCHLCASLLRLAPGSPHLLLPLMSVFKYCFCFLQSSSWTNNFWIFSPLFTACSRKWYIVAPFKTFVGRQQLQCCACYWNFFTSYCYSLLQFINIYEYMYSIPSMHWSGKKWTQSVCQCQETH